jgi:MFS family permease
MPDGIAPPSRWQQTFAALKYPNYRLWFFGQMVSLMGTWMQSTAQGYLIYQLTRSPAFLGAVGFASGVPTWVFMLYAGVIADRMPRRTLLVITQTAMMLLAFALAALTFTGLVQPWHIVALAFLLGLANAFDAPARQAFTLEMVEREDLTNAIALNATMFNMGTAVGPAVAGLAYAALGPGWCFTFNGLSFIAIIIPLLMMKLKPFAPPARRTTALADLLEGLRYVARHPVLRVLVGLAGIVSLFGISFATLIPAWAVKILGGDAATNGLLQSARGLGALLSALFIASLGRFRFKGRLLTLGTLVFPVLLLIFAFVRWLPLALALLVGVGIAQILVFNLNNALAQTQTLDALRGRVMGLYSWMFFGFMPVGALVAGNVAERIGEPPTVVMGALISLAFAVAMWVFLPKIRALE